MDIDIGTQEKQRKKGRPRKKHTEEITTHMKIRQFKD